MKEIIKEEKDLNLEVKENLDKHKAYIQELENKVGGFYWYDNYLSRKVKNLDTQQGIPNFPTISELYNNSVTKTTAPADVFTTMNLNKGAYIKEAYPVNSPEENHAREANEIRIHKYVTKSTHYPSEYRGYINPGRINEEEERERFMEDIQRMKREE